MSDHLTYQQEHFAQLILIGYNQSAAYRTAYPRSQKWKPEAVWTEASQLAANPKVARRIAELRAEVAESAKLTLEKHLQELEVLKRDARMAGDRGVALKAEELRGKASGFYAGKGDGENAPRYTREELLQIATEAARAAGIALPKLVEGEVVPQGS